MGLFDWLKKREEPKEEKPSYPGWQEETGISQTEYQHPQYAPYSSQPQTLPLSSPIPPLSLQSQSSAKDIEVISAKLDTIKAQLDNIAQRLANLERIARE